ncbi:hypothetical protein RFI_34948 [Reticulomyxa filosa]|uniref:Uncharacterized protein n=1 Tax=Reticulomyxa filosa TaxID=46433 RepID=X6LKL9_RETFI|nr:hypothetical protein RFI_34948 [Reticulomyxa filosa]|eukprot:ETO02483.1 hypothetical protein RFI_34948 [Reticulomyxa filosa]
MKGKHHLSNNSLEIICAHLFEKLKMTRQQINTPTLELDIIQEFFKLIVKREKEKKLMIIEWPYRENQFQCLVDPNSTNQYKANPNSEGIVILDNIIIR